MSLVKIILLVPEIALLLVFVLPLFMQNINAGNIVGILAALALMAVTIFWSQFTHLISSMWSHLPGRISVLAVALVLVFGVFSAGFLSIRMAAAVHNLPDEPCTVVVLGCHVKGTKPSLMLKNRLDVAYEYLTAHPEVSCIVTGGQGFGEDITEAQAMMTYLTEKGIAPERILMEDKSTDTEENLRFAREILTREGLSEEILIVTNDFHQYRASLLAERLGLESYAVSCKTKRILMPTYWVREWFALVKAIFLV